MNLSIRTKLVLFTVIPLILILLIADYLLGKYSEEEYTKRVNAYMELSLDKYATIVNNQLQSAASICEGNKDIILSNHNIDKEAIFLLLKRRFSQHEMLKGNSFVLTAHPGNNKELNILLVLKEESSVVDYDIKSNDTIKYLYEYSDTTQEWYQTPKKNGQIFWGAPYIDSVTNKLVCMCSYPIIMDKKFIGVAKCKFFVYIIDSQEEVLYNSFRYIIVDEYGNCIYNRDTAKILNGNLFTEEINLKINDPKFKTIDQIVKSRDTGHTKFIRERDGEKKVTWVYYTHINGVNWSVIAEIDESDALGELKKSSSNTWLMIYGIAILVIVCTILWLTRRLTSAIKQLTEAMDYDTIGDPKVLNIKAHGEIASLVNRFNAMSHTIIKKENDLKNVTRRLEQAFQATHKGIIEWSTGGNEIYLDERTFLLFGYAPGELPSSIESLKKFLHPENSQYVIDKITKAIDKREKFEFEFTGIKKNGEKIFTLAKGIAVDNTDSDAKVIITVEDISLRKNYEIQIKTNEKRYSEFINVSKIAACEYYHDTDKYWFSDAYLKITGIPQEKYDAQNKIGIEKFWGDIIYSEDADVKLKIHDYIENSCTEVLDLTYRLVQSDGKIIWVLNRIKNIIDDSDNKVKVTIFIYLDITRQKEIEEALVSKQTELNTKLSTIEKFIQIAAFREEKIVSLKKEINECLGIYGENPKYDLSKLEEERHVLGTGQAINMSQDILLTPKKEIEKLPIESLLDLDALQNQMDNFYNSIGMTGTLFNKEGKKIVSSKGNSNIVCGFHNSIADMCTSSSDISDQIKQMHEKGEDFLVFDCKNGFKEAISTVYISGSLKAYFTISPFLFEKPSIDLFTKQAKKNNFDVNSYLQLLSEVQILSVEKLKPLINYFIVTIETLAALGLKNKVEKNLKESLKTNALELEDVIKNLELQKLAAFSLAIEADEAIKNQNIALIKAEEKEKEIRCLFEISSQADNYDHNNIEDILLTVVKLLPEACRYTESTKVKISFDDLEFISPGYMETECKLETDIILHSNVRGKLEVVYIGNKVSDLEIEPFSYSQQELLVGIARVIANFVERRSAGHQLKQINEELEYKISERTEELEVSVKRLDEINKVIQSQNKALNLSAIVITTDINSVIVDVNDQFCKMAMYSKEEVVGSKINILNSGHHTKEFWDAFYEKISSGQIWRGTILNKAKDGSQFWVDAVVVPIVDDDGTIRQYLSISFDKTMQKITEQKLHESEAYGRLLFQESHRPMLIIDERFIVIDCNAAAVSVYGFAKKRELKGKRIFELSAPLQKNGQSAQTALEDVKKQLTQDSLIFEWMHRRDNGENWDARVYVRSFLHQGFKFYHVALDDITEQKNITRAIQEAEERSRSILSSISDGIYGTDNNGFITFVNPGVELILGFSSDELIGKEAHCMFHHSYPDGKPMAQSECELSVTTSRSISLLKRETVFWRKDGTYVPVEYSSEPMIKNNHNVGAVVSFADISKRKALEYQLKLTKYSIDNSADLNLWINPSNGIIINANKKAWESLGYKKSDFITKSYFDVNNSFNKITWRAFSEDLKNYEFKIQEGQYLKKDGQAIPTEINFRYLRFENVNYVIAFAQDITERKKSEEALIASQKQLQSILDNCPVGVFISKEKVLKFANPWFKDKLNLDVGQHIDPIFYNMEDITYVQDTIHKDGRIDNYEIQCIDRNGQLMRFLVYARIIVYDQEQSTLIWFIDITERKKGEERVKKSKELAESVVQNSPLPIVIFDLISNKPLLTNKALLDFHGVDIDTIYATDMSTTFSNFSNDFQGIGEDIALKRSIENIELDMVRLSNQEKRNCLVFINLIEYNSRAALILAFIDITETKKLQCELLEAKILADKIVDVLPIPTVVSSKEGTILRINDAMLEFHGMIRDDDEHNLLDWYVDPSDRLEILMAQKETGSLKNQELRLKKISTNEIRDTLVSLISIQYRQTDAMLSSFIDITDLKHIQEELKLAKKLAEEATIAKSAFLANMSHEIRTPMNAILGLTHLALNTNLNPKQLDYVTKIDRSAQALLGIVNDILDFSKIEAGKLTIEDTDFNLENVIEDVSNLITIKAQQKGLNVIILHSPDVPFELNGDPLRLTQILTNLCSNAVKFTSRGEIVIASKLVSKSEDKVTIEFSVKDTGIGLTEEQVSKLFQSFTQADNSTTRKYGGTGLGLTISKRLVELMGGKIWVESQYNIGSTFLFTIVFNLSQGQQIDSELQVDDIHGLRVLVCDDTEASRQLLQQALHSLNFEVDLVDTGDKVLYALEHSNEKPYDIIIMDWKMRDGMDGLEIAKKVRQNYALPKTPIIIMSIDSDKDELLKQVNINEVNATIVKPATYSVLFNSVVTLLENKIRKQPDRKQKGKKYQERILLLRGAKILLVEDNEINQQVASELLESKGFYVDIANNGKEAVDMVCNSGTPSKYDMVFMDLQMPVMDGYTSTINIRKLPEYDDLPIIAMTADAMSGIKEKCMSVGMMGFVTKPINPDEVFEAITQWVKVKERNTIGLNDDAAQNQEADDIIIPKFELINTTQGLLRINNNKKLYLKLLNSFRDRYSDFANNIKKLIKSGDISAAEREAHTLKGVSSNIGAQKIAQNVHVLELKLKQHDMTDIDQLIYQVSSILAMTLEELGVLPTQGAESFDDEAAFTEFDKLKKLLDELVFLMEEDDFAAKDKFEELKNLKGIGNFSSELKGIEVKFSEYDYEAAIALVKKFKENIKTD